MLKNLFLLLLVLLITSCGYRNTQLTPLLKKEILANKGQNEAPQDGTDIADQDEENPEDEQENSSNSNKLNSLLRIYLKNFIKEVVVSKNGSVKILDPNSIPDKYNYDTRVDYQGMYKLYKSKNKNYIHLTKAIRREFKTLNLNLLSDEEKLAFYINAYNFFAMDVIVRNYKKSNGQTLKSIKEIKPTFTNKYAIFTTKFIRLSGVNGLTHLDHIEKKLAMDIGRKLQAGKTDARLHFAIICASIGCPIIPTVPYTGEQVNEQLDLVTAQGLKHARMFKVAGSKAIVSKIFDWYKSDFDNDENGPRLQFLRHHTQNRSSFSSIGYINYNWNLNAINGLKIKYNLPEIKQNTHSFNGPCSEIKNNKDFKLIATCSSITSDNISGDNSQNLNSAQLCLYKTSQGSNLTYFIEGSMIKTTNMGTKDSFIIVSGISTSKKNISFIDQTENQAGDLITYEIDYSQKQSILKIKTTKPWFFGLGQTSLTETQLSCLQVSGVIHE